MLNLHLIDTTQKESLGLKNDNLKLKMGFIKPKIGQLIAVSMAYLLLNYQVRYLERITLAFLFEFKFQKEMGILHFH